jgi:membrane protease YdiL (CAAX protease family)
MVPLMDRTWKVSSSHLSKQSRGSAGGGWSFKVGLSALLTYSAAAVLVAGGIVQIEVYVFSLCCMLGWLAHRSWRTIRSNWRSGDLGTGLLLVPVVIIVGGLSGGGDRAVQAGIWLAFYSILGALLEEIVIRGHMLMPLATRTRIGGIAFTGVVFGMGHFQYGLSGVAAFSVVGIVLSTVAVHRGSIGAPLVAHLGANLAVLFVYLYLRG